MPSNTRSNPDKGDDSVDVVDFIKSADFSEIIRTIVGKIIIKETKQLRDKIVMLEEKIETLNVKLSSYSNTENMKSMTDINEINLESLNPDVSKSIESPAVKTMYSHVARKQMMKKSSIQNTNSNSNKCGPDDIQSGRKDGSNILSNDGEWKIVNRKRKTVIIHGSSNENTSIKAATRYVHYHVFRLDPKLTREDLEKYLNDMKFEDVKCIKITSKHPDEYSSFKVTVPARFEDLISSPTTWPKDTCVNRFLAHLWRENSNK